MLNRPWKRLGVELLAAVLAALLAAGAVFLATDDLLSRWFDRYASTEAFAQAYEDRQARALQAYVTERGLSTDDAAQLDAWQDRHRSVSVFLYRDDAMVYGGGIVTQVLADSIAVWGEVAPDPQSTLYTVRFADGELTAQFFCFYDRYYYALTLLAGLIAFAVFTVLLLLLIRRKTIYITRLRDDLRVLEGGRLEHEVTIRGQDELAELAHGINDMRLAIIDRQRDEQAAHAANRALVTAMSHDLRSPLTALLGYLDIVRMGKYENEEQLARFLESSRSKALQIKELSDKLFEYFLVYDTERQTIELESADGGALLAQTVGEGLFDLESRGFTVERAGLDDTCRLLVNVPLFRRLIDNLFSNIIKYADPAQPVRVACRIEKQWLTLTLENTVRQNGAVAESTEIGLKTCGTIARDHGGTFCTERDGARFIARLCLPCEKE